MARCFHSDVFFADPELLIESLIKLNLKEDGATAAILVRIDSDAGPSQWHIERMKAWFRPDANQVRELASILGQLNLQEKK